MTPNDIRETQANDIKVWRQRQMEQMQNIYPQMHPSTPQEDAAFKQIRDSEALRQLRRTERLTIACVFAAMIALGIVLFLAAR